MSELFRRKESHLCFFLARRSRLAPLIACVLTSYPNYFAFCTTQIQMRVASFLLLISAARGVMPNASLAEGVPLFAHIRWANFSASDLAGLKRFRSVTVQVEPASPIPCEAQARDVKARLGANGPPVLMYGNLFFSEPGCDYNKAFLQRPDLWLNESDGKTPYLPGGRYTFDMSQAAAPSWWASNVISATGVDGGFGDSGCQHAPGWFNITRATAFNEGDIAAHVLATAAATATDSLYVVNCPVLPAIGDPYFPGTRAFMLESWCSDFQPHGSGVATFCRDELLEALVLGSWGNISMQARFYLNKANAGDPQFGLAAFLIAAWEGAYFGASVDWNWAGDWEKLLSWPWAGFSLGAPSPAVMGDKDGCGWTRSYENANVSVNLCDKHLYARIDWLNVGVDGGLDDAQPPQPVPRAGVTSPRKAPPPPRRARVSEPAPGELCPRGAAEVSALWAKSGRACISL